MSNSEDTHLRIWNSDGICLETYSKDNEKQWMIANHPTRAEFAIGTEESLVVLSLEPELIVYQIHKKNIFYIKDYTFQMKDLESGAQYELSDEIGRPSGSTLSPGVPDVLSINKFHKDSLKFFIRFKETKNSAKKLMMVETSRSRKPDLN